MTRKKLDEQLRHIHDSLTEMGKLAETAISDASRALTQQDIELAKSVIAHDDEIDSMEKEIENLCLKLILRHQPVARDLRLVSSVLKIITDLERIGDQAADISEITTHMANAEYSNKLEHIPQMAEATKKMVTDSIHAMVNNDLALAKSVIDYDDIVDSLFFTVKKDLIELIRGNHDSADQAFDLIMIAKYFERIGDHATNVAEWVVFSITGTHKDTRI